MANRPVNTGSGGAAMPPAGHRATRRRPSRAADGEATAVGGLAWLPYLIVLAGVAVGMFVVWLGSKYAGLGAAIVGCSLLAGPYPTPSTRSLALGTRTQAAIQRLVHAT